MGVDLNCDVLPGRHHYGLVGGKHKRGKLSRAGFEGVSSCMQEMQHGGNQGGRSAAEGGRVKRVRGSGVAGKAVRNSQGISWPKGRNAEEVE